MTRPQILIAAIASLVLAGAIGFGAGRMTPSRPVPTPSGQEGARHALYWYDPMVPTQHFATPGKSPFMDMQLVPKYANAAPGDVGVRVDPAKTQALGVRLATVERGALPNGMSVTGVIGFNERDVAVVQARAAGFVQRVYGRAPGDTLAAGAPLADLLIPEWAGAQGEYLAVRSTGDASLIAAARQRLALLGMPPSLISAVERSGRPSNVITIATPNAGVIKTLGVRTGMAVTAGQTLVEVNGLSRVWLNAAVPEGLAGQVQLGQSATANLAAYPGEAFNGRVTAILPQIEAASRTLTARIELPNPGGRLKPGMFATVRFGRATQAALLVPSEAVIRTGRRALVMLAKPGGRYTPAEVKTGREADGRTEVLAGLSEGEKVVASGQFLLDSEASLSGIQARAIASGPAHAAAPVLHESVGTVEAISAASVTLSHEPLPEIGWPAMTMQFRLADQALSRGVKTGDRVSFAFEQAPAGPTVRRMSKAAAQ